MILTDLKDGDDALEPFLEYLDGETEFIASGEGSESPFHQWDCAFYLCRAKTRRLYAAGA